MCGRLTVTTTQKLKLNATFPWIDFPEEPDAPRYNVAPTQPVTAVLDAAPRTVTNVRWGLIPRWAKDAAIGNKLFNARAETLAEKPSFRDAFSKRRCVILADGFYEWSSVPGEKLKQPYLIRLRSGEPFAIAGLWDRWDEPGGSEVLSCTLITTTPNELLARIHNRMPVILAPDDCRHWLAPGPPPRDLLAPFPVDQMTMTPVSTLVNNARNEGPRCIEERPETLPLL